MTAPQVHQASPIRRTRATKAEVEARREALLDIIEAGRPMTVRQVFYQATVRGLVEKAESGYGKIQTDLTVMRRAGELPYDWLADNTRGSVSRSRSIASSKHSGDLCSPSNERTSRPVLPPPAGAYAPPASDSPVRELRQISSACL